MMLYNGYYTSPLGPIKVQCSEEFVKAVVFCSEVVEKEHNEHTLLTQSMLQLDAYFNGQQNAFSLPIQQDGTAFQKKVWELLQKIPFGKTISYQQLAKQYGDLRAIRAVASANGRNNLAILVPCHRVIGSNQSLTGYAGGLWRKKWLLEHEAKYAVGVEQLGLAFG
jgi:methylated-DNA-[protein]-cysteine S-methyltransferase